MDILCSKADGVLTIQFNRPERKNAITTTMYQAMADAINDGEQDAAVRAILIIGQPEIFTAGNDLDDFAKTARPSAGEVFEERPVFRFMRALNGASKPVVAAVSGAAVGIGTTLLMHCDLVYAADNAKFSMPFVQLGLCPEFASSLLFTQLAGYPRAAEKLMLGEAFLADEALQMGLVAKVLPLAELLPFARGQAAKLVALPAASIRATKQLMKNHRAAPIVDTMAEENKLFGAMLLAPEAKEAFTAFFEKRKPDFSKFA
ncbi:enoyl-CoA hydratase/carnithine racemase [Janthinobacterium sp. CG_23.3]|uniref:enoyl-CoA hydratase n=1 Tax=unclassified Janthinobacterium TaxID=2610881 RepID=UPI00034AEACB|nr:MULTISPECIES: enoyl-CoA hydratase [unclassified Janthinobacterium]MEC5159179.1 enoyl-CoA hydratase/carnithine racemase [Janthinobacterium sp. CG_S6]